MDSSRSAQRAVFQFLRAGGEHASQIYRRYGEQYLARCTILRWCQSYEAGRVNIKNNVTNSAMISADHRTEIAVELSISKGTVHHIIHINFGYGKVCAQCVPKHLSENQKTSTMGVCLTPQFLH
ncbi:hypothetical protein AVEN_214742-1 [Araneus ventricosus]|uniref:Mos1 transposase HTH domain-containing protein n=1 Tax=Araneus ventricosus TaxID=182803 RepID=A0A4Y2IF72_ARAVE|nr:hypothetical protein AVEN_214742-1 [Araneus ventricosus]